MANLDELRKEIDAVDEQLVKLLEKRLDIVTKIGEYKIANNIPVIDRSRSELVIEKAVSRLSSEKYKGEMTEMFSNMISVSENMQKRTNSVISGGNYIESVINASKPTKVNEDGIKIVFQGTEGSFGQAALYQFFGTEKDVEAVEEFENVFEKVSSGEADYGVLPIENSQTGSIVEVYDLFRKYRACIIGEVQIPICHNLLGVKGADISDIKTVYSHPQGILQCREFLKQRDEIDAVPMSNTAIAAKYVADTKDKTKGAIASKIAAESFGLDIIKENINTAENNTTKFVIIARNPEISGSASKISLCFTLPNIPGALSQVMLIFAKNGLNMLKIESRPIQNKKFEYFFFCDILGNINDESVKSALNELPACTGYLEILGNY